jgi:hypothetical protein
MMMTGRIISASTLPPTNGVERGRRRKLRKIASPNSPKMIDGTVTRLLMTISSRSVQAFLRANSSR